MGNGVVHVGAHKGEEVADYIAEGRSPIICFEPQNLRGNTSAGGFFRIALGNYNGTMNLHIPHHLHDTQERDTMSASGLPLIPENAKANGWTPTECDLVVAPVERFDDWAKREGFEDGSCSLLVIDVQGMEMQVLEGFGEFLANFRELKIECSEPPLYMGGASASEVVAFLSRRGFSTNSPMLRHGDIHFSKEN